VWQSLYVYMNMYAYTQRTHDTHNFFCPLSLRSLEFPRRNHGRLHVCRLHHYRSNIISLPVFRGGGEGGLKKMLSSNLMSPDGSPSGVRTTLTSVARVSKHNTRRDGLKRLPLLV